MSRLAPVDISGGGKLVLNVMHFARALRAAGLPIGPGKTLEAVEAQPWSGSARALIFIGRCMPCLSRALHRAKYLIRLSTYFGAVV